MGMVVKTNMMALNSHNALRKNNNVAARAMEKLASGQRINRAADDASGLAISEKMKAKIKALDTAITNVEDGAALIQTAEGYMGEVHDMLNRMVELAEKSANGTYESVAGGGAYNATDYTAAGVDRAALQAEMDQLATEIDRIADTANFNGNKLLNGSISSGSNGLKLQIGETDAASDKLNVRIDSFYTSNLFSANVIKDTGNATLDGNLVKDNGSTAYTDASTNGTEVIESGITGGKTFNISEQDTAASVAVVVKQVISHVSMQRANLGAQQNRLEYTTNNLATASENTSAANSRIRDTDMAKTMMQYTQANVLTQAAQAMLAQANQAPQSVLQMIQ
jgi:flagellin